MARDETPFWSSEPEELFRELETTSAGMSSEAARRRLEEAGANRLRRRGRASTLTLFLSQFRSPIIILLLLAAILSFLLRERTGGAIILIIVFASGFLGFWQERGATRVVERLLALVQVTATVLRDGVEQEVPLDEVVPGDLVVLTAGAVVPGDGRLIESRDLFVNEAALTGEAYPVEKEVGTLPAEAPLGRRRNVVLMGTNVISGEAKALIIHTGRSTEFGGISNRLRFNPPQTSFERGVHKFGYFLLRVTSVLVAGIFVINVALHRPVLDAFLPLLPGQILLTNLLTDFPEMTIAADRTDPEMVEAPRRWDIHFIRRFMLNFGVLSSVFDYLTFGILLLLLRAPIPLFRAGWFVESVVSAAMIVLVIRSRRPFYRSRPGRLLVLTTVLVIIVAVALPYSPLAGVLGFAPLPPIFLAALAGILVLYVAGAELVKRHFYRRAGFGGELRVAAGEGPGGDQEERQGRS